MTKQNNENQSQNIRYPREEVNSFIKFGRLSAESTK